MKYYSDKTKKFYETADECMTEEKVFDSCKKQNSVLKKKLADDVAQAESKLNEAYDNYSAARDEASSIVREAEKKAKLIVDAARDNVVKAQKEKETALRNFNDKFGTYTVTYTGEDAMREFRRATDILDTLFNWRF